MSKENEAVETIIEHKANKMKKSRRYESHIKNVLSDHHIEASKEAMELFKMGAVDAMIYDVGAALDFTKQKRSVDDWASWEKRKEMLRKIFPKKWFQKLGDAMNKVNEAVETIIRHKADRIIDNKGHTKHIEDFLSECGINVKEDPVKVFKICAVDAMIYDVGAALDSPSWKYYPKRKKMLGKIFPKK